MKKLRIVGALILSVGCASALAADKWSGYLCCNMRTDGSWITDINYDEPHKHLIPVGSPGHGKRLWPFPREGDAGG